MMNETEILRISAAVDDRTPRNDGHAALNDAADRFATEFSRQHAADAALRAGWATAMAPAPASLTDRIDAAISAPAPIARIHGGGLAGWRAWGGALAAAVALAAGVGILAVRMHTVTTTESGGLAANASAASPLSAALVNLDARPDPVLRRIEDPLVAEAERLREDTRRAAERVLAQLPVRVAWR